MLASVADLASLLISYDTSHHSLRLPKMDNLTLDQDLRSDRRWPQVCAVDRPRNMARIPKSLPRNGRDGDRRAHIKYQGHSAAMKVSGRVRNIGRDLHLEDRGSDVRITLVQFDRYQVEIPSQTRVEELLRRRHVVSRRSLRMEAPRSACALEVGPTHRRGAPLMQIFAVRVDAFEG